MATMVKESMSPVKDKNYDLIHSIQLLLEHAWRMDTYIADAEQRGDTELASFFRKIQENHCKAGEQGKQMLVKRLQNEKR